MAEEKKVLLSAQDLWVKFHVRGRTLTAIRGISLDIYENEAIAIVGESGSGKSVFTKTFAGMLDSNGFISGGSLIFSDPELIDVQVPADDAARRAIEEIRGKLDEFAKLELGTQTYRKMLELESEKRQRAQLAPQEEKKAEEELSGLKVRRTEAFNLKQTFDPRKERDKIRETSRRISQLDKEIKDFQKKQEQVVKARKAAAAGDSAYNQRFDQQMAALKAQHEKETSGKAPAQSLQRNQRLAKEVYLSLSRCDARRRGKVESKLMDALKEAMRLGTDLGNEEQLNAVFEDATFRVRFLEERDGKLYGACVLNLAKMQDANEWCQIRGRRIATVFQDPMTSLNPIITIGKQITSIILKHQKCTEVEARKRALTLMQKVGIPNAEARFDDYPFQYSGGMRQRIVIAIALSCQPKILICDEPTTALDVTIQAQILQLIKDLQKEFNYTIVFITHDLGVVANVADRVAVLYAGQLIELGKVEEVFYDPRHPYTWALLSSLPQLAQQDTQLYSITGTPPSLYKEIVGNAFAPRNPYCMKIDTLLEPPMFQVTDTHYAKTWLLDPDAPKIEKPEGIQDIHEKLLKAFNI